MLAFSAFRVTSLCLEGRWQRKGIELSERHQLPSFKVEITKQAEKHNQVE
jgi:hypothetical protein